ncbi:MAG TPA: LysR family transcriptional regulator [Gaiellaceae bacterium]|jgi:DNA-binding transcriptional LysR family regulator|nr:LysR family transcriptional regulator [Gaiellaceae bacterium]
MADQIPLSLRQLQYFAVVAEVGSVTRAAKRLHTSQPSLSHQLRVLEAAVGATLFERRARGTVLTPVGRAMLPGAKAALASATEARRSARAAAGLDEGELRIATSLSLALGVLPHALRQWFATHPGVEVKVHEHSHADLVRAQLLAGEADVALAVHPDDWEGPIFDLGDEELVVIVARNDPLALRRARAVALGDLRDRRWVLPAVVDGFSEYVEQLCSKEGFVPEAAVRSSGVGTLVALAASGLGPTLVPANAVPDPPPGAVLLLEPPIRRRIAVYAAPANAELAAAFAACAKRHGRLMPSHLRSLFDRRRRSSRRAGATPPA